MQKLEKSDEKRNGTIIRTQKHTEAAKDQQKRMHENTTHCVPSPSISNSAVVCNKCRSGFHSLNTYREHLHQVHGIFTTQVEHQFSSEKEFQEWKKTVEIAAKVHYRVRHGSRNTRHGRKQTYYCHKPGEKKLRTGKTKNLRGARSQGTSKICKSCTSSIEVLRSNDKIHVTFFVDHCDHGLDAPTLIQTKFLKCNSDKITDANISTPKPGQRKKSALTIDEKNQKLREEIKDLAEKRLNVMKNFKQTVPTYSELNEGKTQVYTGLPSSAAFSWLTNLICGFLRKFKFISPPDQLLLTLMKLRLGLTTEELAYRFGIGENVPDEITEDALSVMACKLRFLLCWSSEDPMSDMLCSSRKKCKYSVTIDCIEFPIEEPFHETAKAQTWSNCMEHNTVKAMIGVAQYGSVIFVSKCWGGRISNKELVLSSGFLNNVKCGDVVTASRDFLISDALAVLGARLEVPSATPEGVHLTKEEKENSQMLLALKQAFQRIMNYKILSDTLPYSILPDIDKILICCSALSNLQE